MWNVHEIAPQMQRKPGNRECHSLFHSINGFCNADNWLENLLSTIYDGPENEHQPQVERDLRSIVRTLDWGEQRALWAELNARHDPKQT